MQSNVSAALNSQIFKLRMVPLLRQNHPTDSKNCYTSNLYTMKYSFLLCVACICFLDLHCIEGIVDGTPAKLGDFPYVVGIEVFDEIVCGGALINIKYVLTAGKCLINEVESTLLDSSHVSVRTGAVDPKSGISIKACSVEVHPFFRLPWMYFDAGVIKLSKAVKLSNYVKIIGLPWTYQKNIRPGVSLWFTGYGMTGNSLARPENLKKKKTILFSPDFCEDNLVDGIHPIQLCASSSGCQGDYGGPLTMDGKVIVGIASKFSIICDGRSPDVYTNVSEILSFIREAMDKKYAQCT